jgi:alpha-glucosidase
MPRRQYCLHQFLPCQPCLNHHCDAMRAEQHRILRFWKDRGVDGFRFDAVTAFFHDPGLRDNPPDESLTEPPTNPYAAQRHHYDMMPNDCAAYAADLRAAAGDDMFLLGEINRGEDGMQLAVDFTRHGRLDAAYALDIPESCADGRVIARALEVQAGEDGQAWWMCSHDQPRMIVRAGDGSARDARLFAALHCAMPGALMTYQGEEIGQRQADLPFETLRDPYDRLYWPDVPGRDGARVPLPWDTNAAASGFTVGTPWLPVGRAEAGGIAQQEAEAGSVLGFYRRALALRRRLGLTAAKAQPVEAEADWIAVRLLLPEGSAELCVNFGDAPRALPAGFSGGAPLLTSAEQPEGQVAPRSAAWWQGGG